MDLIYGNAVFTICTADGPNASTGLLAMHEGTGTGSKDRHIAECSREVRLVVTRETAAKDVHQIFALQHPGLDVPGETSYAPLPDIYW